MCLSINLSITQLSEWMIIWQFGLLSVKRVGNWWHCPFASLFYAWHNITRVLLPSEVMTQPHEFSYSLCSTFSFLFHCWGGVVFPDKRVWRGRLERKKLSSAVNSCGTINWTATHLNSNLWKDHMNTFYKMGHNRE